MAEGTYVVIRRSAGLLRDTYALVERFDDRAAALTSDFPSRSIPISQLTRLSVTTAPSVAGGAR